MQSCSPRSPFRNWLYRIATNLALDTLRGQRNVLHLDTLSLATNDERPEDLAERKEQDTAVQQAVLALPLASRVILILQEYSQLSYREIADTLNIPIGTVMSHLNCARSRLRESLAPYLEGL